MNRFEGHEARIMDDRGHIILATLADDKRNLGMPSGKLCFVAGSDVR